MKTCVDLNTEYYYIMDGAKEEEEGKKDEVAEKPGDGENGEGMKRI